MSRILTGAVLAVLLAMSGCDGSSGGGKVPGSTAAPPVAPSPPPPPPSSLPWQPCTDESTGRTGRIDSLPTGYWAGTLTSDARETTDPFWLIVAPDGRFRAKTYDYYRYYDPEIQWVGSLDVDATVFRASATVFEDVARDSSAAWLTSNRTGDLTFAGGFVDYGILDGGWDDGLGNSGCFELGYVAPYGDTSLLGDMTGTWTAYGPASVPQMTFTVDADGSFIAQDVFGCTATGRVDLLDQQFGLFDIQSTMSGCALAGNYSGFASLGFVFYPERTAVIYMDDGTRGLQVTLDD